MSSIATIILRGYTASKAIFLSPSLCAIDPRPAQLNNPRIIGMFTLFADLIAFHLAALQKMEQTAAYLNESYTQLSNYKDEIRQYRQLSNHNLQEPLRKIRLFSDILLTANANQQQEKVKETTLKINRFAKGLSEMIRNIGDFSGLDLSGKAFETTDLNIILQDVTERLYLQIVDKGAVLHNEILHIIKAIPGQLSRLFYHLLSNSLKFSRSDTPAAIRIYSHDLTPEQVSKHPSLKPGKRYCEVCFEDNGIGIAPSQLEKIFDLFSRTTTPEDNEGFGVGLAQCRKIVRNHNGLITAHSEAGKGATFSVILPIEG
jgi:signal transduction histidine kinase